LRQVQPEDVRIVVAQARARHYGVAPSLAMLPLSGYLAGVMALRRQLTARHLGHFYSFLQIAPRWAKGIEMRERVQSSSPATSVRVSDRYVRLTKRLGRRIDALHDLASDRLVVPVHVLKHALSRVPLTSGGFAFMIACEIQIAKSRRPRYVAIRSTVRNSTLEKARTPSNSA
jgi:hypothetical protein